MNIKGVLRIVASLLLFQCGDRLVEAWQLKDDTKYDLPRSLNEIQCPKIGGKDHCPFAPDYCSTLELHGNTPCAYNTWNWLGKKRWGGKHNYSVDSARYLKHEKMHYELKCYSWYIGQKGFRWPLRSGHTYDHICHNAAMKGGPRFGFQKVGGEYVFITGPDSPHGYHEGKYHRMWQMDIPNHMHWITVWPYTNDLKGEGVTKVQFAGTSTKYLTSAVNTREGDHQKLGWFKIKIWRSGCGENTANVKTTRVNILQVTKGTHYSMYDRRDVIHARVEPTYSAHTGQAWFDLKDYRNPIVLLQSMNCYNHEHMVHMRMAQHDTIMDAYMEKNDGGFMRGDIGAIIIALHNHNSSEMFGPYAQVVIRRNVSKNVTSVALPHRDAFPTTYVFTEMQSDHGVKSKGNAWISSSSPTGYTFRLSYETCQVPPNRVVTHHLVINAVDSIHKEKLAVRETLRDTTTLSYNANLGCPYLSSQGACAGLYKLKPHSGSRVWEKLGDNNYVLKYDNDYHLKCWHNGKFVEQDRAGCVFSDGYCRFLSILTQQGREDFAMYGDHTWGYNGGNQVNYTGRDNAGYMAFDSWPSVRERSYVCVSDVLSRGPVYGLNRMNGEDIIIVNSKDIIEGLYFRIFQFDAPANGSPVTVYPMGFEWGVRATATKLTVKFDDDTATVVPRIVHGEQATFSMELWYPPCVDEAARKGTVRVNVLQVRTGRFTDPWGVDHIAANTATTGLSTEEIKYSFPNGEAQYLFAQPPILFSQVYDYTNRGAKFFLSTAVSDVTTSSFKVRLQGYQYEAPKNKVHFHWIGISVGKTDVVGSTLFGASDYLVGTGAIGDTHHTTVKYDLLDVREEPFVFTEGLDKSKSLTRNAYVSKVGEKEMEVVMGIDKCSSNWGSESMSFNWLSVSKWLLAKHKVFNHSDTHHCYGKHCPLLHNYCDKLAVLGNMEYSGIYKYAGDWTFARTHDLRQTEHSWSALTSPSKNKIEIRLNYDKTAKYVPTLTKDRKTTHAVMSPQQVVCLKESDYSKRGRMRADGHMAYNVQATDLVQGPYVIDWTVGSQPKEKFVYFKYFQMEVNAADAAGKGLYTYVGGEDFGNYYVFGTAFDTGGLSVALAFQKVDGRSMFVRPMFGCKTADRIKVNVLVVRHGEHRSRNGQVAITALQVPLKEMPGDGFFYADLFHKEVHDVTAVITALQQTNNTNYAETGSGLVKKSTLRIYASTFGDAKGELANVNVGALMVNMGGHQWKGKYEQNLEEFKIVAQHWEETTDKENTFPVHVGNSGNYAETPFMIAGTRYIVGGYLGTIGTAMLTNVGTHTFSGRFGNECNARAAKAYFTYVTIGPATVP